MAASPTISAVVSSLTVHWPSLILAAPPPGRDGVLAFSVHLACLGALVETLLSFDRVLVSSRAFDLTAAGYPRLPMLSVVERESQRWNDLYNLQGHVAALNERIYEAISSDAWFDTVRVRASAHRDQPDRSIVIIRIGRS